MREADRTWLQKRSHGAEGSWTPEQRVAALTALELERIANVLEELKQKTWALATIIDDASKRAAAASATPASPSVPGARFPTTDTPPPANS